MRQGVSANLLLSYWTPRDGLGPVSETQIRAIPGPGRHPPPVAVPFPQARARCLVCTTMRRRISWWAIRRRSWGSSGGQLRISELQLCGTEALLLRAVSPRRTAIARRAVCPSLSQPAPTADQYLRITAGCSVSLSRGSAAGSPDRPDPCAAGRSAPTARRPGPWWLGRVR